MLKVQVHVIWASVEGERPDTHWRCSSGSLDLVSFGMIDFLGCLSYSNTVVFWGSVSRENLYCLNARCAYFGPGKILGSRPH